MSVYPFCSMTGIILDVLKLGGRADVPSYGCTHGGGEGNGAGDCLP